MRSEITLPGETLSKNVIGDPPDFMISNMTSFSRSLIIDCNVTSRVVGLELLLFPLVVDGRDISELILPEDDENSDVSDTSSTN